MRQFTPEEEKVIARFTELQSFCFAIMLDRQRKYGLNNIGSSTWEDVLVRANDKMARLRRGTEDMGDESATDAFLDLANYALIALMRWEGTWPDAPREAEIEQLKFEIADRQARLALLEESK